MLRRTLMFISATLVGGCIAMDWDYSEGQEPSTSGTPGGTSASSGGGTTAGACGAEDDIPVVSQLAGDMDYPRALAVDADSVYWSTDGLQGAEGYIWKAGKFGGEPEQLSPLGGRVAPAMVVDETHIYWIEQGFDCSTDPGKDQIQRVAKDGSYGGVPETAWSGCGWPTAITHDAENIYVTMFDEDRVQRHDKATGDQFDVALDEDDPVGIATDESALYWANSWDEEIIMFDKAQGTRALFAVSEEEPSGVAVDAESVFWITEHQVVRLDKATPDGEPTVIAHGLDTASEIAVDDRFVYVSDIANGQVLRGCKDGSGAPVALAGGQDEPIRLVVDAMGVYWTNHRGGQVMAAFFAP